jgi:hypothetical protein
MLKRVRGEFRVLKVHEPTQLIWKAPVIVPVEFKDDMAEDVDPENIYFAGLGAHSTFRKNNNNTRHPHWARNILLRSAGYCEHPGCAVRVYMPDDCRRYVGLLGRYGDDHWMNWGVFCESHASIIINGTDSQRKVNLMFNSILQKKGAFRANIDSACADIFIFNIQREITSALSIMKVILPNENEAMALIKLSIKMRSIPSFMSTYYYEHMAFKCFGRKIEKHYESEILSSITKVMENIGVMAHLDVDGSPILQDTIFTDTIIERLLSIESSRAKELLRSICYGQLCLLERYIMPVTRINEGWRQTD